MSFINKRKFHHYTYSNVEKSLLPLVDTAIPD